jgi:3-hydroxyisobutyrate dehydrogenase
LAAMSRDVVHLGPLGSGALLKLINNFLCGLQVVALAEAMALIERGGLERDQAVAILTGGAPGSPLVRTMTARMTARDYTPQFLLRLMAKDLTYATAEARGHALDLATAQAALHVLRKAMGAGHGDEDVASIVELFRK